MRYRLRPQADFLPPRLDQCRDLRRERLAGRIIRIERDGRAARVVAVEALPIVQEIFGPVEGPENKTELGRGDVRVRRPGIRGVVAVDARPVEILAHARDATEGVG